jgi:2-methylisocitrate lyase-like PEP mutase family enzyme
MGFDAFARLHEPGRPFLLPNAWDYGSAALFTAHGFPAVGTTSLGVAAAHGRPDGAGVTRAETVALARSLARLPCLLTVDVEGGFSDDPGEVADLVAELAGLGVVGVNIEDGRASGELAPIEHLPRVIAAVKARAPRVFLNARTDTHWLAADRAPDLAETLRRVRRYADAGADGVFVPALPGKAEIAAVVEAAPVPVNVLFQPAGPDLGELAGLGVARVSTGSLPYRAALHAALAAALGAAGRRDDAPAVPSYAEIVKLLPS